MLIFQAALQVGVPQLVPWNFALPLVELEVPISLFLQPVKVSLDDSISATLPSFAESIFCPISQIINEELNGIGANSDPSGKSLITGGLPVISKLQSTNHTGNLVHHF